MLLLCLSLTACLAGCQTDRALTLESGSEARAKTGEDTSSLVEGAEADGDQRVICVHVCGAVKDPGLKELPAGSRVWDALEAAGGFTEDADQDYVNLAGFPEDGQQLYFPTREEVLDQKLGREEQGKVDLNSADEAELCTLPGIGSSRAKAILKYRKEQGSFQSVDELLSVPGIKEGIYEQIRDLVTVGR